MRNPIAAATESLPDLKRRCREEIWQAMKVQGLSPAPNGTIPTFPGQNIAAERLRRLDCYKKARSIMVPPDRAQLQVRINAMVDAKRLIMATPGLRQGFFLLDKKLVGAKDWKRAVSSSGVLRFGKRLRTTGREIGPLDLLVTGAVAVGLQGGRLGKGTGYFDLEYAILQKLGCVTDDTPIVAVVHDLQVLQEVSLDKHDVPVGVILTPTRSIQISNVPLRPSKLWWNILDWRRVRKMRPLSQIFHELASRDRG